MIFGYVIVLIVLERETASLGVTAYRSMLGDKKQISVPLCSPPRLTCEASERPIQWWMKKTNAKCVVADLKAH